MRRLFSWRLSALLFVAIVAGASDNSDQSPQSPSNPPADSPTSPGTNAGTVPPATSAPSVTVTGKVPPLPKLSPDKFTECFGVNNTNGIASVGGSGEEGTNWMAMVICMNELSRDTRIVIDKCINRDGK